MNAHFLDYGIWENMRIILIRSVAWCLFHLKKPIINFLSKGLSKNIFYVYFISALYSFLLIFWLRYIYHTYTTILCLYTYCTPHKLRVSLLKISGEVV